MPFFGNPRHEALFLELLHAVDRDIERREREEAEAWKKLPDIPKGKPVTKKCVEVKGDRQAGSVPNQL